MRLLPGVLLAVGLQATSFGQTPYPAAPPTAANITRIEYFVDTDPGTGNGTPLPFTPQTNISALSGSIDLSALSLGFHRVFFRAMDANGKWSFWLNGAFSNVVVPVYPAAPPAAVNIVRIEYFLDANPIPGTGVDVPVTPGTDITASNVVVDISALSKAAHTLFVAAQDASGKWSITNLVVFTNANAAAYPAAPAAAANLQQLEYFIDNDPGLGNATPVSFTPGTQLDNFAVSVDISALSNGTHYFFIRSRSNPWSLTNIVSFQKGAGLPVRWQFVKGEWKDREAELSWATSFEQNTSHFDIEQSADGLQFRKIGSVAAAGNSTVIRNYRFADANPVKGWNYYRIRQTDLDGKYEYSKVITLLNRNGLDKPLLYPNPATSQVYVELPDQVQWKEAGVYSASGQLERMVQLENGKNGFVLDVKALPTGQHIIVVTAPGRKEILRFVK